MKRFLGLGCGSRDGDGGIGGVRPVAGRRGGVLRLHKERQDDLPISATTGSSERRRRVLMISKFVREGSL